MSILETNSTSDGQERLVNKEETLNKHINKLTDFISIEFSDRISTDFFTSIMGSVLYLKMQVKDNDKKKEIDELLSRQSIFDEIKNTNNNSRISNNYDSLSIIDKRELFIEVKKLIKKFLEIYNR